MALKNRVKVFPAVLVFVFNKKGEVLLHKRSGTTYMDGYYDVPSGHPEEGETFRAAAIRELKEETGLTARLKDLEFTEVFQLKKDGDNLHDYIHLFFRLKKWTGIPKIMEPNKASSMDWFPVNKLPRKTIPYIKTALSDFKKKVAYCEYGWR